MILRPTRATLTDTLFPYTTRFRSRHDLSVDRSGEHEQADRKRGDRTGRRAAPSRRRGQNCLGGSTSRKDKLGARSEEHTSELQSLMRTSYAVFCLKKKSHYVQDISILQSYMQKDP